MRGPQGIGSSGGAIPLSCRELNLAAVEETLVKHHCNVAAAAKELRIPASDLRRLVSWGPLAAAAAERVEQSIDDAQAALVAGLRSPEASVRLKAAGTLLALSPAARRRGWGRGRRGALEPEPVSAGAVTLKWLS
jgi:hypothetical protein